MNLESLGLIGVFLAGAIPWMEAVAVVPAGILLGLDPTLTVLSAAAGNVLTIVLFAYLSSSIRVWIKNRRLARGKSAESPKYQKAVVAFEKYGLWGMAILGPILIGTQFAAAACVAAGVKPRKVSIFISVGMFAWAVLLAVILVSFGVTLR